LVVWDIGVAVGVRVGVGVGVGGDSTLKESLLATRV
jgi:hypothetical protein